MRHLKVVRVFESRKSLIRKESEMKEIKGKKGRVEVIIRYDKESKYYKDEAYNIVSDLDKYRVNKYLSDNKGKAGTFIYTFQAVDKSFVSSQIQASNKWLDKEYKKVGKDNSNILDVMDRKGLISSCLKG